MQYLPRALGTIDFIFKKTPCPRPKTSSFPSERHISFLSPPSPTSPPPDSSSPRPRLESLSVPRSIRQSALHTPYPERGRHHHRSHHNHRIVSLSPTTGPLPLPCLVLPLITVRVGGAGTVTGTGSFASDYCFVLDSTRGTRQAAAADPAADLSHLLVPKQLLQLQTALGLWTSVVQSVLTLPRLPFEFSWRPIGPSEPPTLLAVTFPSP